MTVDNSNTDLDIFAIVFPPLYGVFAIITFSYLIEHWIIRRAKIRRDGCLAALVVLAALLIAPFWPIVFANWVVHEFCLTEGNTCCGQRCVCCRDSSSDDVGNGNVDAPEEERDSHHELPVWNADRPQTTEPV
jgi:hypothetical protein